MYWNIHTNNPFKYYITFKTGSKVHIFSQSGLCKRFLCCLSWSKWMKTNLTTACHSFILRGEDYSKSLLISFRNATERHLNNPPYNKSLKLNSASFTKIKNLKKQWKGNKKKGTDKPKATVFDPWPSYMQKQIQLLSFEAVFQNVQQVQWVCMLWLSHNYWRRQFKIKKIWMFIMIQRYPNMSHTALKISHHYLKEPLCNKSRMLVWCFSFSDDEIVIVEKKKNRLRSKCADWYHFKKGHFCLKMQKSCQP